MGSVASTLNNRYRLDKKIGEGGFAQVFLATDLELGRQVAVKVLEQNWAQDPQLLARFRNEARAIAALDHPNILVIYDYGVAMGAPYLVMPYVSGGTLEARMKQERFTLDEIGFYLDQIGSALDYAHQRGIVHRDVKPANLLMRPDGQLVLMDFGLSKLLDDVSVGAKTALLGTVGYMAPEQLEGFVSAASDIYMLGVILYQMLAGQLPFVGSTTEVQVRQAYLALGSLMNQPAMNAVHPAVVQELDQVLLRVLARNPADRYPTCQALCNAYYEALRADPKRASRGYSRNKGKQDFSEKLLVDKQFSSPSQTPGSAVLDATVIVPPDTPPPPLSQTSAPNVIANVPGSQHRRKILLKPPRLFVTTEPDKGFQAIFDLTGEILTLGRATDNTLHVPLSIISRHHAELIRLNNGFQEPWYKIVPRKSINPLVFKGEEVSEKVLEHGDIIEIGRRGTLEYIVTLVYQVAEYGFV